jgi:transcriptional regulator with XRE-family HTH domain
VRKVFAGQASAVGKDEDLVGLGRKVRLCRKGAGMSQEELAERAGVHRNYIGLVERGERNASAKTLFDLARALSVSPAEFFQAGPGDGEPAET